MSENANNRIAFRLIAFAAVMLSLSFAAVPLYDWFCRVTGYGGTTDVAQSASDVILEQTIKVRFDASLAATMQWDFKPVQREMEIRIGETGIAFYEAHNPTNEPIAGTANFNVSPFSAGAYFAKIECFCFEQQVLEPGQTVQMPVTFYVDPEIVDDREAKFAPVITLSYTFHRTELPEADVTLGPVDTQQTSVN